jgi:hypothetical protein
MGSTAQIYEYEQMRKLHNEVVEYATAFEISLENNLLHNATLTPASGVWDKIKLNITTDAPVVSIAAKKVPVKKMWKQYAVAACVAIMLGSIVTNFMLGKKLKESQAKINTPPLVEDKFAFLKDPTITPVAMYGVGLHSICRCSLYWDKNKKSAYFQIHHLFNPGAKNDYQLWAKVDGKMQSLGVIKYDDNKLPIAVANIPDGATQFSLTLENKGGSEKPNLEELYLEGKISA